MPVFLHNKTASQRSLSKGSCFNRYMSAVYKPSSVFGGHLSSPKVTNGLQRNPESLTGRLNRSFVSCSGWGLQRGQVAMPRVGSYPAFPPLHVKDMRTISVALSLGSPPPGIVRHPALRSSDFPHACARGRPTASQPHANIASSPGFVKPDLTLRFRPE